MPKKHTYEYVKNYIEGQGYTLLSKEYKNSKTKLELQCPEGHIFLIKFNDFTQGHRCIHCYNNKRNEIKKKDYNDVKFKIESEDYRLLSKHYFNNKTKLKLMCPQGHIFYSRFDSFLKGNRCPECSESRPSTNQELIGSLQLYETIKENKEKKIEVTCRYCGK